MSSHTNIIMNTRWISNLSRYCFKHSVWWWRFCICTCLTANSILIVGLLYFFYDFLSLPWTEVPRNGGTGGNTVKSSSSSTYLKDFSCPSHPLFSSNMKERIFCFSFEKAVMHMRNWVLRWWWLQHMLPWPVESQTWEVMWIPNYRNLPWVMCRIPS